MTIRTIQLMLILLAALLPGGMACTAESPAAEGPSAGSAGEVLEASPPGPVTPPSEQAGSAYRIHPGDVLRIDIFGEPDLSGPVRIPADGRAALPLIGEIPSVVGKTVAALRAELEQRYEAGYLVDATVTITVQEFKPRHAFVLGQVHVQGSVELTPFIPVTALQAISRSGGFRPDADRQAAKVFRADPANPGAKLVIPIPAGDLADNLARDVTLEPDDMIVVPLLGGVVVVGKVRQAGAVALTGQGELTVTRAIAMAGGFEKFARGDLVQLIRPGSPTRVVNAAGLLDGSARGEDPALKPGDTVFVPDAKF